ncbi:MAG: type IV secretion system DNA-binding domain-containing protein [Acidobacteria bacterium]|nr:type IV secretion system DNA-binding domain-containing protein [Acidobacteriota bacterium]MCI0627222.1 type IV secretion system DNA-binding domain-containing protein [Acidobacteriota bacterium]
MRSRAYVAHDHAVSVVRMYFQMIVVGLALAVVLYATLMAAFLSRYVAAPIAEIRTLDGQLRMVHAPRGSRLPLIAVFKYFVSLNPRNYIRWNLNPRVSQPQTPQERVDRELVPFFRRPLVPRETYRSGIRLITRGRVDQLPWIIPSSLVFFPAFGVLYFFAFRQVNKRLSETRFVRGANLTPISQMKQALAQAIAEEKQATPEFLPLQLGVLDLPDSVSRRHTFVAGTTGTGKSVCLNQYIRSLHRLSAASPHVNKSVIYDVKGEFTSKHHREGDVIFYPFDRRSIGWSFFNDPGLSGSGRPLHLTL